MTRVDELVALAERARAFTARPPKPPRADGRHWYRIANAAGDSTPVYVYDEIGEYGVSASSFVEALAAVTTKQMHVHINSPGGSVFDGIAIHAALVNHKATVHTIVDGIAASAASFIAQAGETRGMEKPAQMMIHDAWGLVVGNPADLREAADILDSISDSLAGIYADRAGGEVKDFRAAMRAETWYTSAQAVTAGLADTVLNDTAPQEPAPAQDRRRQLIRARARVTLRG